MTVTSFVVMSASWIYLTYRSQEAHMATQRSLRYLTNYFGYLAIFLFFMSVPYLWFNTNLATFSDIMAWGYVVGHVFFYVASMYVTLLVCSLVPQLYNKIPIVVVLFLIGDAAATVINAKTMIWGVRPVYDAAHNLTLLRAAPAVGIAIALSSILSILPAAILFAMNAFRGTGFRRLKSTLLATGFLLVMIGGPMNDNSHTAAMYATAVAITITGVLVLGFGVGFRVESVLAEAPAKNATKLATPNAI
jgi:hypothetical protein